MLHKLFIDKAIKAKLRGASAISRSKFIERETEANIAVAEKMKNLKKTVKTVFDIIKSPNATPEDKQMLENALKEEKLEVDEVNKNLKPGETFKRGVLERTLELIKLGMTLDEISDKIYNEGYTVYSVKKINDFITRGLSEGLIKQEEINIKEKEKGQVGRPKKQYEDEDTLTLAQYGRIPKNKVMLNNKPVDIPNLFKETKIKKEELLKSSNPYEEAKSKKEHLLKIYDKKFKA